MKRGKNTIKLIDYRLIPILAALCLLPLTVYAKVIHFDVSMLSWYSGNETYLVDIFNYYKSIILIISALTACPMIFKLQFIDKEPLRHRDYVAAYTYVGIVLASTALSISTYYSLQGYINHLENMWVLLAYVILFIYTAETVQKEKRLTTLVTAWQITICLLTLIGLTQFLGFDLYRTDLGISMIVPSSIRSQISDVDFTLWSDNLIYQSLFNYNYVSFYSATAFPFFLAMFISAKNIKERVLHGFVLTVLVFNLFGSQGRNGLVGIFIGTLIVVLLYGRQILLNKYTLSITSIIAVSGLLFITFTDTIIEQRTLEAFTGLNDYIDYPLNSIDTENNTIIIDHDEFNLIITGEGPYNDTSYSLDGSSNYSDNIEVVEMTYQGADVLQLTLAGNDWHFILQDGQFLYLNQYGKLDPLNTPDTIGFEGTERWGSKRGYIWSRSLPLIIQKPLLGYGPDTYAIAFPQNDYVGKLNAYNTINMIVDKPHNILINYAVNTGLLSMIAVLYLIGFAFLRTFRYCWTKNIAGHYKPYAIGSLGAIVGYLSAGMFNDTSLHVTPVFWITLGINYAVTRK